MIHRIGNLKIGPKLFISFILAVSTSIFFVLYFSYEAAQEELEQHFLESLIITADAKEKHIESFFQQVQEDISRTTAEEEAMYAILEGREGRFALEQALLDMEEHVRDDIFGITVLNKEGEIVSSTLPSTDGMHEVEEANEERVVGFDWTTGLYVSDIFVLPEGGPESEKIFFSIVSPLYGNGAEENIIGFAEYYFDLDKLQLVFENETEMSMYMVNRRGVVIGKSSSLDGFLLRREIKTLPVEKCVAGGSTSGIYKDYNGKEVLGASTCIDRLTFIIEMKRAQVLGAAAALQQRIALVAVLILLEVLILMYFLTRFIVKPLKELAYTVDRFGKGEWDHRSSVDGEDEIGVLARTFNRMADTLQDLYENLEDKVKERTQELQKFKLAVESASDHITITDAAGTILYTNAVAEELTGYKMDELIGKSALAWRTIRRKDLFDVLRKEFEKSKKPVAKEMTCKRKSGKRYIANVRISPIFDDAGSLQFFVLIENDVTKAREVDRAKSEFVSLASHQLRTPLSAINWYTELLLGGDAGELSDEQRSYLQEVYNGSQRMVELVNALLNVSRLELGTFSVVPESIDLPAVAESVLGELTPQITSKEIEVEKMYGDSVPVIEADKQLVRIVFQNLLSNAVKYTPQKGKVSLIISREAGKKGGKGDLVRIVVSDTGYGIPSNQQTKIFTKLFRADNAKERVPEGNGLGLYLVRSVVERVGGSIWFESEEGKGTIFTVLLPIRGMKAQKGTTSLS